MNTKDLLKLRDETGAGIMSVKKALEEAKGDIAKAKKILLAMGVEKAAKKQDREIKSGLVYSYTHGGDVNYGKIGVIVKVGCETDFVAKTQDFKDLCKEIAMQISAMDPKNVEELLDMDYIRDNSKKVKDLVTALVAKVGENIVIDSFSRLSL